MFYIHSYIIQFVNFLPNALSAAFPTPPPSSIDQHHPEYQWAFGPSEDSPGRRQHRKVSHLQNIMRERREATQTMENLLRLPSPVSNDGKPKDKYIQSTLLSYICAPFMESCKYYLCIMRT